MNLLFLNHNYKGEGTYNRAYPLALELTKRGHQVTLLSINNKFPSWRVEKIGGEIQEILLPTKTRRKDYFHYFLRPLLAALEIPKIKFDIAHAFTVAEPLSALPAWVIQSQDIPLFVDWDDWYGKGGLADLKPAGWFFQPFTNYLEEKGAGLGKGLTVVSSALHQRALSLGIPEEKITQIGNGSNFEKIKPLKREACKEKLGLDPKKPVVLYLGWFNKASFMALQAFKDIEDDFPEATFVSVGRISMTHDHLESHQDLFKHAENSQRYHLEGPQPYEKIPHYIGAADVILLPMENTVHEHARFPIRLGDFLAGGRAIVASNIGEVGKIINDNKCGITANSNEEFTEALKSLLSNPELMPPLEKAARETAETKMNWKNLAESLEQFYKSKI